MAVGWSEGDEEIFPFGHVEFDKYFQPKQELSLTKPIRKAHIFGLLSIGYLSGVSFPTLAMQTSHKSFGFLVVCCPLRRHYDRHLKMLHSECIRCRTAFAHHMAISRHYEVATKLSSRSLSLQDSAL
jgi:hypothetical protein